MNELLVARWRNMAEIRNELAVERRANGEITAAIGHTSAANAYERCARELEALMRGESPPPVGEQWPSA